MEKFRQFADGGTGVNPFVPEWANYRTPLAMRILKNSFMLPFALLRLACFAGAILWLAGAQLVATLIPVGFLRYPVYRVSTYVGCFAALGALGVLAVANDLADHRRLRVAPPKLMGARPFNAAGGTIILSNFQGLVDVLLLCMKACPVFVFPAADGSPVEVSLLGALGRAGARRPTLAPTSAQERRSLVQIAEAAQRNWQPVVVFAEGARTTGKCVLLWKAHTFDGMESFDKPVGTALVSIQYSRSGAYTPHHTVGTMFRHIFWMCMQPFHTAWTTWLPASDVAVAIQGKKLAEQATFLRTVLVRMIPPAVEVDIGAEKHTEFMAYWDASQRKGYTQQQQQQQKKRS